MAAAAGGGFVAAHDGRERGETEVLLRARSLAGERGDRELIVAARSHRHASAFIVSERRVRMAATVT